MDGKPLLPTPRLVGFFDDYEKSHRTFGNKLTHGLGIPLIVVSLLGLLGRIEFSFSQWTLDGGVILILVGAVGYFLLDWKVAFPFVFTLVSAWLLGRVLSLPILWSLFVLGWILQGVGHSIYEKKSPAFFNNVIHLLIGPIWIFSKAIGYR